MNNNKKVCKLEECNKPCTGKGYCNKHYQRWYRHGDPRGGYYFFKGQSKHELYKVWDGIKERCHNQNNKDYKNYGGRGITMCDRWRYSFENFITDMGKRPTAKHMIERIDNNGNYEPGNCKWATITEQIHNRRIFKNNVSGYPGVYYVKKRDEWTASIYVNNKQIYLGAFNTFGEAMYAKKFAEKKYW